MSSFSVVTIGTDFLSLKETVLRQQAIEISTLDQGNLELCKNLALEMFEIMYANDGAALAAPQIGIPLRLVTIDPLGLDFGPNVLINPKILFKSETEVDGMEGCLSLPRYLGKVFRSTELKVQAYDLKGQLREYEINDWLARIFQHELDHLDGVLYPDRLRQDDNLIEVGTAAHRRAIQAIQKLVE